MVSAVDKKWGDLSQKDRDVYLTKIAAIYEKNKATDFMPTPTQSTEIINKLKDGSQYTRCILQIYAEALPKHQEAAGKVEDELKDLLKGISSVQINIHKFYGFNSQFESIKNVAGLMEGGKRKDGYLELKHKAGQVLILMFWNSWNPAGNK